MKRFFKKVISAALAAVVALSVCACGSGKRNDAQTLRIFTTNAGYGTAWLDALIEAFQQEDWVKEKYPDLYIPDYDKDASSKIAELVSAENANEYSLLFSCQPVNSIFNAKSDKGGYLLEDLSDVYFGKIEGESDYDGTEGKQLKDKIVDTCWKQIPVKTQEGTTQYFTFPWIRYISGLFYNKTKLDKYISDYTLPNTTDELLALTKQLKEKLPANDAPWAYVAGAQYVATAPSIWYAQYEGFDAYERYWKGVDEDGEYSSENFAAIGRLRALEVLESLIGAETGYTHSASLTNTYMQVQSKWLTGKAGVFMPSGDWLLNEMDGVKTNQTIGVMSFPVISSIIEQDIFTSVDTDAELSFVISCIDANKDYETTKEEFAAKNYGNLTEAEYDKIFEARRLVERGSGHEAVIPSYAVGKEVAKDFLRFMSSDKGIEIFMNAGKGFVTVFDYDVSDEMYNSFTTVNQSFYDIKKVAIELPPFTSYKLYQYGGLRQWKDLTPEVEMAAQNVKDRKTAKQFYDEEVEYYTKDDSANFKDILKKAGLM